MANNMLTEPISPLSFDVPMNDTEEPLFCFVLMPFNDTCEQVYDSSITPAFSELKKVFPQFQWQVTKANDKEQLGVYGKTKVETITDWIKRADVLVVDITDLNPNVMWELGYADALKKRRIMISDKTKGTYLPFNIRTNDVLYYDSSNSDGKRKLKDEIITTLTVQLNSIDAECHSLSRDDAIIAHKNTIFENLLRTPSKKFLRVFALREMKRLVSMTESICAQRYQIRNKRPAGEVINFFKDSLRMLSSERHSFDTISCLEFWKVFTSNGTNFEYLLANSNAAKKGAKIRRVIVLHADRFPGNNVKHDQFAKKLLKQMLARCGANLQVKLYFTSEYGDTMSTYENFGILKMGNGRLAFCPEYDCNDTDEREMTATSFFYSDSLIPKTASEQANNDILDQLSDKFDDLWADAGAVTLAPSHFE